MKMGSYSELRERMNVVFWEWVKNGRKEDAVRLLRAWEKWWHASSGQN